MKFKKLIFNRIWLIKLFLGLFPFSSFSQTSVLFFKNLNAEEAVGKTKTFNQFFFNSPSFQEVTISIEKLILNKEFSDNPKSEDISILFQLKNERQKTVDSVFVNLDNNSGNYSLSNFNQTFKIQQGGEHKLVIDFDNKTKLKSFLVEVNNISVNIKNSTEQLAYNSTWFIKNNSNNKAELPFKIETPLKGKPEGFVTSYFKLELEPNQINGVNIQKINSKNLKVRAYLLDEESLKNKSISAASSNIELVSFLKSENQVGVGFLINSNEVFSLDASCKKNETQLLKESKNLFSAQGDTVFYWDFELEPETRFPINSSLLFDCNLKEIPLRFSFLNSTESITLYNDSKFSIKTGAVINDASILNEDKTNFLKNREKGVFFVYNKTTELSFGNKIEVLGDFDKDQIPDILDFDADNDGISNINEFYGLDPFGDKNKDGVPNFIDPTLTHPKLGSFKDVNLDGINDIFDVDKDGRENFVDLDSDNDGILDLIEGGHTDIDHNGFIDEIFDEDRNGMDDKSELVKSDDFDKDGIFDFLDLDSDDDGIPDLFEGQGVPAYQKMKMVEENFFIDYDHNGILDYFDIFHGGKPIYPVDENKNGILDYVESQPDGIKFDFNVCDAENYFETEFFSCESELAPYKCVEVDLTESLDPNGKELEFNWKWGDGTTSKGVKQRHCYETQGIYKIFLDVINPKTKQLLSQNEFDTEVSVRNSISLAINGKSSFKEKEVATFTPILNIPPHYKIDEVLWNFNDHKYDCGETYSTRLFKEGNYSVTCVVFFSAGNDVKHLCFTKNIVVTK